MCSYKKTTDINPTLWSSRLTRQVRLQSADRRAWSSIHGQDVVFRNHYLFKGPRPSPLLACGGCSFSFSLPLSLLCVEGRRCFINLNMDSTNINPTLWPSRWIRESDHDSLWPVRLPRELGVRSAAMAKYWCISYSFPTPRL